MSLGKAEEQNDQFCLGPNLKADDFFFLLSCAKVNPCFFRMQMLLQNWGFFPPNLPGMQGVEQAVSAGCGVGPRH